MGCFSPTILLIILILFPLCQCSFCVLTPSKLRPFLQAKTQPSQKEKQTTKVVGFSGCLQFWGACSHNCAKISTGAAKLHLGKGEPVPSLSDSLAHKQHSPQEHPIEVTKAGENLPLSLMAKLAGGSERHTCFLG